MRKFYNWFYWFIGTMVLAWLGNFFYDSTKNIPVLKYLTGFLKLLYGGSIALLNYPIKVWVILVALIGLWLLYRLFMSFSKKEEKEEVPKVPEFITYKKDIFKNWIWRWEWKQTTSGWKPINLTPFCPVDDVQLILDKSFYDEHYYCAKCRRKFNGFNNPIETAADAEVLLRDKVNKNTYPKS